MGWKQRQRMRGKPTGQELFSLLELMGRAGTYQLLMSYCAYINEKKLWADSKTVFIGVLPSGAGTILGTP